MKVATRGMYVRMYVSTTSLNPGPTYALSDFSHEAQVLGLSMVTATVPLVATFLFSEPYIAFT